MAQFAVNGKSESRLWAAAWRFGLSCLLAALIFLPYALILLFFGGLPVDMGGGIGSPGGSREFSYGSAPWAVLLVASCFMLLMAGKLLRDRQLVARWRAALLLLLAFFLLSAFLLWQTPLIPVPSLPFYYIAAAPTLLMSIYPAFFVALASAFLCERRFRQGALQKTAWLFIPLSLPAALAGSAFCWFAITAGLTADQKYYQGYYHPPYSPLVAALYTLPTLLGVSLLGGFLGACLYRWFQRTFRRSEHSVSLAGMGEISISLVEQATASPGAVRTNWPGICWGYIWRLGLIGLISLTITGILLHTSISIYEYNRIPMPFFFHPLIEFELYFTPGDWLLPPFFEPLFDLLPFFQVFSLFFLPFLIPFPGVLVERSLWKKRAILPGLGIVLVFLGMVIGAKDLLLALLSYLGSFWPFGIGSALLYCGQTLCETSTLALLAALALGNVHPFTGKWSKRLLWLLIGVSSFAGSLLPLVTSLQKFVYYADGTAPFHFLSLDTATIGVTLASGLLLSILAAFFGGSLRILLIRQLLLSNSE